MALKRRHSRLAGLEVVTQQHRRTYHSTVWERVKGSAYRLEQSRRPDDRPGSGVSLERCEAERFVVGRDVGRLAPEQLAPGSVGDSLECDERKGDLREKLEQNLVVGEFDAQVSQQFLGLARVGGGENGVAVKTFADGPEHRPHHDCRFACSSRHPDCPKSTVLDDLLEFINQDEVILAPPETKRMGKHRLEKRLETGLTRPALLRIRHRWKRSNVAAGLALGS